MQVSFQKAKYYSNNQNIPFEANAYFLTCRKMYSKIQKVPEPKRQHFMSAIDKIKTYFIGCEIGKYKLQTDTKTIRNYFLKLPDSRGVIIPLISINHRWGENDIIEIGNKLEQLAVKYPEYNPQIAKYINKHERWSYKVCK